MCLNGGKKGREGMKVKGDVFKRREERVEGKGEERRCVWKEGRERGRERRSVKGGREGRERRRKEMCESREGREGKE